MDPDSVGWKRAGRRCSDPDRCGNDQKPCDPERVLDHSSSPFSEHLTDRTSDLPLRQPGFARWSRGIDKLTRHFRCLHYMYIRHDIGSARRENHHPASPAAARRRGRAPRQGLAGARARRRNPDGAGRPGRHRDLRQPRARDPLPLPGARRRASVGALEPAQGHLVLRPLLAAAQSADVSQASSASDSQTIDSIELLGAEGGSRTRTPLRAEDFESSASAIPPLRPRTTSEA